MSNANTPPVVNIQVARTCNLRCSFCSHQVWKEPSGLMTWPTFELAMLRMREDQCKTLCFVSAQGEALLHPKIFDMLARSLAEGFETNLVTNGTPLTPRRVDKLAGLELHAIQMSFAGYDQESYERLYVGARFVQVVVNLMLLIKALAGTRTALTVNGIVDQPEDIKRTIEFLCGLGLRRSQIMVNLPHNWGGTVKVGKEQDGIFSHRNLQGKAATVCKLLSTQGVYVDGRVTACGCIDANGALEIGHLEDSGIAAMRDGDRYQMILGSFRNGDISALPLCGQCEIPYQ